MKKSRSVEAVVAYFKALHNFPRVTKERHEKTYFGYPATNWKIEPWISAVGSRTFISLIRGIFNDTFSTIYFMKRQIEK